MNKSRGLSKIFWNILDKNDSLFSERKEIRLITPKENSEKLFSILNDLGFMQYDYGTKLNRDKSFFVTIYFGPISGNSTAMIPRIRLFNQCESAETIDLSTQSVAVLELKVGRKFATSTKKQKETVIIKDVMEGFNKPEQLFNIFERMRREISIPVLYPSTKIDLSLIQALFDELDNEEVVPIFATQSRRIYFTPDGVNPKDTEMRVSIDLDKKYFIFPGLSGQIRNRAFYVADESGTRIDIKFENTNKNKVFHSLLRNLKKVGVGEPTPTHENGRKLYKKHKKEFLLKHGFLINEIPGKELESKLQVIQGNAESILKQLMKDMFDNKVKDYSVLPELKELLIYEGHHLCYGYNDNGKIYEALTIVEDDNGWHLQIKSLPTDINNNNPLIREEKRRHVGIKNETEKVAILKDIEILLGRKIKKVGEFDKKKMLLSIINNKTKRQYSVSAGICVSENGKKMSQIEVEYIARQKDGGESNGLATYQIIKEVDTVCKYLFTKNKGKLKQTKITKFQWLVGCVGLK